MTPTPQGSTWSPEDDDVGNDSDCLARPSQAYSSQQSSTGATYKLRDSRSEKQSMGHAQERETSLDARHIPRAAGAMSKEISVSAGNNAIYEEQAFYEHSTGNIGSEPPSRSYRNDKQRLFVDDQRPFHCAVLGCPAGVTSWKKQEGLNAHYRSWHKESGLASQTTPSSVDLYGPVWKTPGLPPWEHDGHIKNGYEGQSTSAASPDTFEPPAAGYVGYELGQMSLQKRIELPVSTDSTQTSMNRITTRDPHTMKEKLDPRFKVRQSRDFRFGKVFKVLWSEPSGNSGYESSSIVTANHIQQGDTYFMKVRRFVVIKAMKGHCICLPILTYGGQGTRKRGVHPGDHAPISNKGTRAVFAPNEREHGLLRTSIRFTPKTPLDKLDGMSRINYAKPYTVEYNVKVLFIGKIDPESERELVSNYNEIHPPLQVLEDVNPGNDNGSSSRATYSSTIPDYRSGDNSSIPAPEYASSRDMYDDSSRPAYSQLHPDYHSRYDPSLPAPEDARSRDQYGSSSRPAYSLLNADYQQTPRTVPATEIPSSSWQPSLPPKDDSEAAESNYNVQ